ncbi:MAG TPA: hypothetical protein VGI92_01815 [Gemmatimonadales bacterium]|jgi:uncharacterized protein YoxC
MPTWIGPTIALSLVVIAFSCATLGGTMVYVVLSAHRQLERLQQKLHKITDDAHQITGRVKGEIEGFATLSAETRMKLQRGIDSVEGRLQDLDALVEVLQEEAQDTALEVAAFMRTARQAGGVLGVARRAFQRRRGAGD